MTAEGRFGMLVAVSFTSRRLRDEPKKRAPSFPWRTVLASTLRIGTPLVEWWVSYWRRKKEEQERQEARRSILKRIGLILGVSALVLVLAAGGVKALVDSRIISVRSVAGIAGTELAADEYGHTNILLLGQGDESHDGVDLTDTIIIASLDPETESAVMLSIPRDLYFLKTQKMGVGRVNTLYRDYKHRLMSRDDLSEEEAGQQAMRELADELGRTLRLQIHHVIKVDFIGFVKAVDAIGGVEIDVPYDIVDREYPGPNYTYQTFVIRAGKQVLDGETALKYARSRHTTSDFSRSARQQQILKEMGRKVKEEGLFSHPGRILNLLSIMQDHVMTTLTTREMVSLGELGADIDPANILSMQLNTENGLYGLGVSPGGFLYFPPREDFGGASVILPVSVPSFPITWKQLQALTHLMINLRGPYLARPVFDVYNAGAPSGGARMLGGELIRYGFQVEAMENAPDRIEIETSYVEADDGQEEAAGFIADLLGIELRARPAAAQQGEAGSSAAPIVRPITIMLGKDYRYVPFQTLLLPAGSSSEQGMMPPTRPATQLEDSAASAASSDSSESLDSSDSSSS